MTWAYRPIAVFWSVFGVFPVSLRQEDRYRSSPAVFTACLLTACVYVFAYGPSIICRVGIECTSESIRVLKEIYPGVVNVTAAVSRVALVYAVRLKLRKYRETVDTYEAYAPTTAAERARYRLFAAVNVTLCVLLILPVNAVRMIGLMAPGGDGRGGGGTTATTAVAALYAIVYAENLTMCCSETQFAQQCFALYRKLKRINREITALNGTLRVNFTRYLGTDSPRSSWSLSPPPPSTVHVHGSTVVVAADDAAAAAVQQTADRVADAIETLRIRHWLVREAIGCLNGLFGTQLGMSVCALCVMAFFDIYYETFHVMGQYDYSQIVIVSWMFHYAARYLCIILMSHYTTKQALYTKTLIANMKSSYLNCNINKELHLFLDQLSYSAVEFTAYDIFTLNIRLITSTLAAGITYLVILVQYQTNTNE